MNKEGNKNKETEVKNAKAPDLNTRQDADVDKTVDKVEKEIPKIAKAMKEVMKIPGISAMKKLEIEKQLKKKIALKEKKAEIVSEVKKLAGSEQKQKILQKVLNSSL